MIIIRDTREKTGWTFNDFGYELEVSCLKEGDYSVKDRPNLIIIERKASPQELATNLGKKFKQFENELANFHKYKFRYIICEFTIKQLLDYPNNISFSSSKKIRMNGKFMTKRLYELKDKYNLEVLFNSNSTEAEYRAYEAINGALSSQD